MSGQEKRGWEDDELLSGLAKVTEPGGGDQRAGQSSRERLFSVPTGKYLTGLIPGQGRSM